MNHLACQFFRRAGQRAHGLPTIASGGKIFFARDVQPLVLAACRAHEIGFDLLALRCNLPRPALALILRGHDPIAPGLLRLIDDFVARAQAEAALRRRRGRSGQGSGQGRGQGRGEGRGEGLAGAA
ncbi:MAG TPA: hypothetical protein VF194_12240 [Ferrovibrio sp.]|uniref:hypothetical protein n=1 Tax=Ferrovibrio sp. TaxID=1917215 RepID=UPI002ED2F1E8